MFQEVWAREAVTRLDDLHLGLPLSKNITNLQLLNPGPVHLIPCRIEPGFGVLGQLFFCKLGRLCWDVLSVQSWRF